MAGEENPAAVAPLRLDSILPTLTGKDADYVKGCIENGMDTIDKLVARGASLHAELRERVKLPGDAAKDEEWREFMGRVGAPKDLSGYVIPDGVSAEAKRTLEGLKNGAFEAALPKRAWDKVVQSFSKLHEDTTRAREVSAKEAREKMRESLGTNADAKIAAFEKRVLELAGGDKAAADRIRASELANDPAFFGMILNADKVLSDGPLPQHRPGTGDGPVDYYDAAKKAIEIGALKAFNDPSHSDYPKLVREFTDCMRMVHSAGFKSPREAVNDGASRRKSRVAT